MTLSITHTTITGAPADPDALVDGPAWDAEHVLAGAASPSQGGTGVVNNDASTITITGSFGIAFTITADTNLTFPASGTLATLDGDETLTNKTIGAVSVTTPIIKSDAAIDFQTNGSTYSGHVTAGQQWNFGTTKSAPPTGPIVTVSKNAAALPAIGTPAGVGGTAQVAMSIGGDDTNQCEIFIQSFANRSAAIRYFSAGGTGATRTATTGAGTTLGANFAYSYTGSVYVAASGFIFANTEPTVSGSVSGSRIDLYATPTGSTGIAVAASFGAGLMVGTTTDPGAGNAKLAGALLTKIPVTQTAASPTIGAADSSTIFNGSATQTATLPAATGANAGRWMHVKNIAAQTVNSASSNVVPLAGGAAGTALLTNTAGKWAMLQSDGTNWIIMAAN